MEAKKLGFKMSGERTDHIGLAAEIVAAFVSNNSVPTSELSALIASTHSALQQLNNLVDAAPVSPENLVPAIPIRKSITPSAIICLEDGKKFKSMKRHLSAKYGLTPDAYRNKWGLPPDYPMVAPDYAEKRSELAKNIGLGQLRARRPVGQT